MRLTRPFIFLLFAASAATAQVPAFAPMGPKLKLADSIRIDSKNQKFKGPVNAVFPGPAGMAVVVASQVTVRAFDSTGHRMWSGDNWREVGDVAAMGWNANEIWLSDRAYGQIATLDLHGNIQKSLELPSLVRPSFSQRKTLPVFGAMTVYAYMADGSMIVVPRRPHSVVATPGYDEKSSYILNVSEDGIIQHQIARVPSVDYARIAAMNAQVRRGDGRRVDWDFFTPSEFWPRYQVSPDGMRTVVVSTDTTPKIDSVTVRVFNEKGDTLFVRRMAFAAQTFTDAQLDSIVNARYHNLVARAREDQRKALPRRTPPVVNVTLGRDKTVWVGLSERKGGRPYVVYDMTGQLIGTLMAPPQYTIKAVDGHALWLVDDKNPIGVSRFTWTKS